MEIVINTITHKRTFPVMIKPSVMLFALLCAPIVHGAEKAPCNIEIFSTVNDKYKETTITFNEPLKKTKAITSVIKSVEDLSSLYIDFASAIVAYSIACGKDASLSCSNYDHCKILSLVTAAAKDAHVGGLLPHFHAMLPKSNTPASISTENASVLCTQLALGCYASMFESLSSGWKIKESEKQVTLSKDKIITNEPALIRFICDNFTPIPKTVWSACHGFNAVSDWTMSQEEYQQVKAFFKIK